MKKVAFLSILVMAASAFSQGTVNFANGAAGVDAPMYDYSVSPAARAGSGFRAQLYVGPAGSIASQLTTNGISGTPATFLDGGGAGYFIGGPRTIDGYATGTTVTLQVRAWQATTGANWEIVL